MPEIDPRLSRHLRDAHDNMLIDAIVIVAENDRQPLKTWSDNGLAQQVMQQATQQTNELPSFVRFIPRANAVALSANANFINTLLKNPYVQVASSATIDVFHFF